MTKKLKNVCVGIKVSLFHGKSALPKILSERSHKMIYKRF